MALSDDWQRLDWFRKPTEKGYADGTLNACYNALDRHVIRGAADESVHGSSRARRLSEVAAFAGALAAVGVTADREVAVLADGEQGVVAALAAMRLGAVVTDEPESASVVISPDAAVRCGDDELTWDLAMRAGRTDPAGCAVVSGEAVLCRLDGRESRLAATLIELTDGARPEHPLLRALAALL